MSLMGNLIGKIEKLGLKGIIKVNHKNQSQKRDSHDKTSQPITINGDINITINCSTPTQRQKAQEFLAQASQIKSLSAIFSELISQEQFAAPSTQNVDNLAALQEYDASSNDQASRAFINEVIPKSDRSIWLAALVIRHKFKIKDATVGNSLMLLRENYGAKGTTIANLCTSEYLEEQLIPLYQALKANGSAADFVSVYQDIIINCRFAVFISARRSYEENYQQVLKKIAAANQYRLERIFIYGIGQNNIKTIKKIIDNLIKSENLTREPEWEQKQNRLKVTVLIN
jgi:biopolymer transport protein ExbD